MHFLTKALVVVAAVLAVAVATLTTAYAINADRIQTEFVNLDAQLDVAQGSLREQQAQHEQELERVREQLSQTRSEALLLRNRIGELEGEVRGLNVAAAAAEQQVAALQAQFGEGVQAIEFQARVIGQLQTENSELQQAEVEFRDRRIELEDRVAGLEGQVLALNQRGRGLEEALAQAQREVDRLRELVPDQAIAGGPVDESIELSVPVSGTIQEVRQDGTGRQVLVLDVGTRDRVTADARLYVIRDGDVFVAQARVTRADLNNSLAVVEFTNNQRDVQPQAGDTVQSRIRG